MAVANEAKYCFKCGNPIKNQSLRRSEPYLLDEKFRSHSSSLRTNLDYSSHSRVWLAGGGFERLHALVNELCDLAYVKSLKVSPADNEYPCHDTISDIRFPSIDTDFYPPDGYESIFVEFHEPSSMRKQGDRDVSIDFNRPMHIFLGRIEHDPNHGKNNVLETKPPRLRKSKLVEKFGLMVVQRYIDRQPTPNFSYSLTAFSLSSQDQYSPNHKGLLSILGLEVVTDGSEYGPVRGKCVKSLPLVQKALSDVNGSLVNESVYEEEWRPALGTWQPFIDVTIKSGRFATEKRRIYL
jgi:hypothetical protein